MQLTQALRWSRNNVPARTATIYGDRQHSWGEFADRVAKLAAGLRRRGVATGDRVGILALNSDRYAEAVYGIAWAGAVFVPFNTRWTRAEILDAAADCGPRMMLVDTAFLAHAADFATKGIDVILLDGDHGEQGVDHLIANEPAISDHCGRGDDIAAIFFTGGTTGRNKGVMLSHGNLMSSCLMLHASAPYADGARMLYTPPLFHLAAASMFFGISLVGGTHVFLPGFDAGETLSAIERRRIDTMILVPTMIGMLCEALRTVQADTSSVRRITYGGSAIAPATLEHAMQSFPNAQFVQAYGQTELSPMLTILSHADHLTGRLSSAGRPVPLADVRIVDAAMNDRPRGEVGEVVAQGPNVMRGYWGLPELTDATIVDGWLRTGDAGYLDEDGYLYLVDHVKDMIVSGGENIYSAEVENALMRHADVVQCAAIGVPDEKWGERVHAILFVREGSDVTEQELAAHCRALIAGYKCPKSFDLRNTPLPLSGAGKNLKTELRKAFWGEDAGRRIA